MPLSLKQKKKKKLMLVLLSTKVLLAGNTGKIVWFQITILNKLIGQISGGDLYKKLFQVKKCYRKYAYVYWPLVFVVNKTSPVSMQR